MCVVVYACVHAPRIGVSAWCVCVFMRALGSSKGPWCAYIVHLCALVNSCALMHRCAVARVPRCSHAL